MQIVDLISHFSTFETRELNLFSEVTGISHDNREVGSGYIFAALPGFNTHGIKYADQAIAAGAVAVLTDDIGAASFSGPVIISENPRRDMGLVSKVVYGDAQSRLTKVGVTGTNGKTTTTNMVMALLKKLAKNPALIGTNGIFFNDQKLATKRTTPESTDLHRLLQHAEKAGCDSLAMEVSSHALELHRVEGILYDVAVFTGLSQDHLDFHKTMDGYFSAKAKLFEESRARSAVINVDDEWGKKLSSMTRVPHVTYGLSESADWHPVDIRTQFDGKTVFTLIHPVGSFEVTLNLPGDFNIANSVAALATLSQLGLDSAAAASGLSEILVAGRLQRVDCGQPFMVLVDYAHTPDAVERAVEVGRRSTSGNVLTVIGCGGDRDSAKRPLMGQAAAASDLVFVTDDNPRSEDPAAIRAAIKAGVPITDQPKLSEIADRKVAIQASLMAAKPGDCVLILGKGHEQGQEVNGVVHPFSDVDVATEILIGLGWKNG